MVTFMLLYGDARRKIDTRFHRAKANGEELKWLYLCGVEPCLEFGIWKDECVKHGEN